MSWTFDVPFPRDASGPIMAVTGNVRVHWAQRHCRHRAIRDAFRMVAASSRAQLRMPRAAEPRCVEAILWREKGQRFLDHDQAYAALKPGLDGLKDAGVIVDDSPRWLPDYRVRQGRDGLGPARVTFTVSAVPAPAIPGLPSRGASLARRSARAPRRAVPS